MIVAGIGTRKGIEASEIVALIRRALAQAGIDVAQLSALATASGKADEAGIAAAAAQLDVPLLAMHDEAMRARDGGVAQSSHSARMFGVSSVSEAAALAASGAGSELILPRIKSARATCALARGGGA